MDTEINCLSIKSDTDKSLETIKSPATATKSGKIIKILFELVLTNLKKPKTPTGKKTSK